MAKIPGFYLKQGSSTPTNLMGRVKTIWELCVFQARPSSPLLKVANGDIWFFTERDCCAVLVEPPMASSLSSFA